MVVLGYFLVRILPGLASGDDQTAGSVDPMENTVEVARHLFRGYLLPFEVTSILILAAVVGAVVLAKRKWE